MGISLHKQVKRWIDSFNRIDEKEDASSPKKLQHCPYLYVTYTNTSLNPPCRKVGVSYGEKIDMKLQRYSTPVPQDWQLYAMVFINPKVAFSEKDEDDFIDDISNNGKKQLSGKELIKSDNDTVNKGILQFINNFGNVVAVALGKNRLYSPDGFKALVNKKKTNTIKIDGDIAAILNEKSTYREDYQMYYHWAHMLDEAFPSQSSVASKRMNSARAKKYDEYYTSYENAGKLLTPFKNHLKGKKVLMPCDNPDMSQMFKWVFDNFSQLGLASLSCTGFGCKDMLVMNSADDYTMIPIANNGDFTTGESLEAMDACDVVLGNPPFSRKLGSTFLTLPIEKGKDVIGIEHIEKCTYGKLKEAILNKELTVYKCPYKDFNVPVDDYGNKVNYDSGKYQKEDVQVYAFSSFNDVHELKEKLAPYFKKAYDIGVRWDDLPDLPSGPRQNRVDIKVLYDYDTGSHVNFNWIPLKPKNDGITKPMLAISTYRILGCNWERYFNIERLVSNNNATLKNPRTGEPIKTISTSYFVFSYK